MKSSPEITAVILCAGQGSRANLGYNKMLASVDGVTVAAKTVRKFLRFDKVVIVCSPDDEEFLRCAVLGDNVDFVIGGNTRTQSVRNALASVSSTDIIVIHDGARPFVTAEIIDKSIESAVKNGSGIAAIKSTNAIKTVADGKIITINRENVFTVQTPQSFRFDEIKAAYDKISGDYADDSEVYELAGFSTTLTEGSPDNVKLTTARDFYGLNDAYRVGIGYDVHKLIHGRRLILCGKELPFEKGLLGHSDADVAVHAVMDALLSAGGLPDIGVLFPDTDKRFEGADSMELLKDVMRRLNNYEIVNVSVCIIAQKPKLQPHIAEMRHILASVLKTDDDRINVSATTAEGLGIVGEGQGMAAISQVLIKTK